MQREGVGKGCFLMRQNLGGRLNRITAFITALVIAAVMLPFRVTAAEKGETVLVGACADFGISKSGSGYSGFAYEYLTQIKKNTGHNYVFVDGTPDELFAMLSRGEIAMIPCVTDAELERYSAVMDGDVGMGFSDGFLITKYSAIYVMDDGTTDSIGFFDIEALNKATIGYLEENATKYFIDGSFVCTEIEDANFIGYATESQMREDLESGKLDAVVKGCFRSWGSEKIAYRFGGGDARMLVSDQALGLKAQITEALRGISITDPFFRRDNCEKYLSRYGVQQLAYTKEEQLWLKDNKEIVAAYNVESDLLDYYDNNSGKIMGFVQNVIDHIAQTTGCKVKIKTCTSLTDCVKLLKAGEADIILGGVNSASMASFTGLRLSSPYSRVPVVTVGVKDVTSERIKVAVPFYSDDITNYLRVLMPSASFQHYKNARLCAEAVVNGDADILCTGAYDAVYLINSGYEQLRVLDTLSAFHTECIATLDDATLSGIIGKSIMLVGSNESVVDTYEFMASYGYDAVTISRFMDRYLWIVASGAGVIIAFMAGVLIFFMRKNRHRISTDPLTGGRNKERFIDDAAKAVKRFSPNRWACVLIDIDKFKFVNDRLGFEEGNHMLERLYKTIGDNLEDDEIYARISDDNFALVIHNATDKELTTKINTIFSEFERRNELFVKYPVFFSAGVCRLGQCEEEDGTVNINSALDRCTIAKKTLKSLHSSSIAFFDGTIRDKALREKDYENIMPTALANHEFQCYLQPKYGLKSRHIEGAEALIRWNSKTFGFVYPNDFIPLSEKNGFVVELDFFILEEVCKAMRRWIDDGKTPVVISVNQSRLHLNFEDYIWRLREIVDKYEIPYEYIELELTESVFTENAELLLKTMRKLHEIGFKLSIDDFGSGYSSLNMLKDIPADVIKIDREFFNGTVNSQKGRAVISTVVDLAKNLNMEVISEGVETVEQVDFLTEIDCSMVQGYYFAKPMTMESFEELWFSDLKAQQENAAHPAAPEAESAEIQLTVKRETTDVKPAEAQPEKASPANEPAQPTAE